MFKKMRPMKKAGRRTRRSRCSCSNPDSVTSFVCLLGAKDGIRCPGCCNDEDGDVRRVVEWGRRSAVDEG